MPVRKKPKALEAAHAVRLSWHEVEQAKAWLKKARQTYNRALAEMCVTLGRAR